MRHGIPPPVSWAKLLSSPQNGWPWPYSEADIAKIRRCLGIVSVHKKADEAVAAVIKEARKFISPPAAAARRVDVKPNALRQTQNLALAVRKVREALEALDRESVQHLNRSAVVPDQRFVTYLQATYGFESNYGLESLPAAVARGARSKPIGTLQMNLESIFTTAHGGRRPVRGWPAFRDACLKPIDEHPPGDPKAREKQLTAAKHRNNSTKKR